MNRNVSGNSAGSRQLRALKAKLSALLRPWRLARGETDEARRASIVEASEDAITSATLGGVIVSWNPGAERMYGYTAEEAMGRTVWELMRPVGGSDIVAENVARMKRGERPAPFEAVHHHRSGRRLHVSVRLAPVKDAAGEVVGVSSINRDVTEREEVGQKLRESEERYRAVMEQSVETIYLYDAQTRRVLESNAAFQEMLGYSAEELLGMQIYDFIDHDREDIDRRVRRTLMERRRHIGERNYRRKDGTIVVVQTSASVISCRGKETVCAVSRDVTELKRAREVLEESEERHRRQARELALLHRVRTALAQELDLPAVFRAVVEAVAEAYGYTLVSAYLLEDEELVLQHQVGYERVIERVPISEGVSGRVARTGEPVLLGDVRSDPAFLGAIEGIVSEVCVPLFDEGRISGTLNVESTRGVELTQDDLRLMGALAEHVGIAIGQARLHDRVRQSEERFRSLIQNAPDVIMILDADSTIRYDSPAIERMLGYEPGERLGTEGFAYVHPEDLERARDTFAEVLEYPGIGRPVEYRLRHKDGSWRHVEAVRTNLLDEPSVEGVVLNARDVTERKQAEKDLRESEERFRSAFEGAPIGVALVGLDMRYLRVNRALCEMLGYPEEDLLRKTAPEIIHPDDCEISAERARQAQEEGLQSYVLERRYVCADGSVAWNLTSVSMIRDTSGEPSHFVCLHQDTTERKELEKRLVHQAFHDPLTDLPNRALFMDRLRQALARMSRRELPVTVLFLDLDNFKTVNDSLGHEAGDRLLVAVAGRLRECVRPEDTLARLGGDEFAVLVEGAPGLEDAERVTRRILERLSAPFNIGGREVFTSANVGIAPAAATQRDPGKLLRDADLAMYGSKQRGKGGYKVFEAGEDDAVLTRLELGGDLRRALERGEFEIYYQPEVSVETGRIEALEALVRWEHPRRGILEPGDFLPVAEEVGLILAIEERVLLEVCRQGRAWQDRRRGYPPLRVCTNVSETLFSQTDLVERVAAVLRETGLEAQDLSLEMAERVLSDGSDATVGKLKALKELGVHVVIENFGTAYSALAVLRRFPLNFLKLDRSLVAQIDEEPENAAIVEATINLAHALGWAVSAHGVETAGQLARLREMGADLAQGYHFSRPVTAREATALLEQDLRRRGPGGVV